ncbi:MAG: DUF262 domain-containing protein [Alphaproteobacteria bacterium GM7ARS4]|nr:DUF262 domain-containing protein [Alphaproteobacteria bacterium GM7ARS4]
MPHQTHIKAETLIFSELFEKGRFTIPWHQRRYDWSEDDVTALLEDIEEAVSSKKAHYFLGTIMLLGKRDDTFWDVNDGQQRMTTFSLLCSCLSRRFLESEHTDTLSEYMASRIVFDIGCRSDYDPQNIPKLPPRLTPPAHDKRVYHAIICHRDIGKNGKMKRAWEVINDFINRLDMEQAKEFLDFLVGKVEVAVLYVPDSMDASAVFETINCRGKVLGDFDLIRNFFYAHLNEDTETRRQRIHDALENMYVTLGVKITDYAKCFFRCKYGFLPDKRFYRAFRRAVDDEGKKQDSRPFREYVVHLAEETTSPHHIRLFHAISKPKENDKDVEDFLADSKAKNAERNVFVFLKECENYTIVRPLLFALMSHYYIRNMDGNKAQPQKTAKCVHEHIKKLNAFVMRTAFVSNKFEPSIFEKAFFRTARDVMALESIESYDMMDFLRACDRYDIIDDSTFVEKLGHKESSFSGTKARAFLYAVNANIQNDWSVIDRDKCTLEHILPQSPAYWEGWQFDNPRAWYNRLGNFTLLGDKDNSPKKKDNENFDVKKEIYKDSALKLSRNLCSYKEWTEENVEKRQRDMAKKASRIWAF